MTELVKSPCIGCRFAEWERTKNGKLHPNKIGRCTWRPKIEPMPWWTGFEKSALVRINGAWVERDDMNPAAYYATCDAREEA